ncbi:hypothetical protein PPL_04406 [Heterostelium album PN500]|uniref:Uncharacterized protein n=1 Tax=Heterostelium pallidum (strain ATCC 26659 / Pp 5 / PN500) TaxID=670386 RepID=D3B7G8_HETP5|nr:hypothetical protein PPL_04406 [Heterostelium album PN500]EFA82711.1 hypothetical protein PPL_04406 [Heterostelium album PN500]|eukprot:XP_020434828.1 hypothetical protein PPL_04406 [Heterostelium album PN500]
MLKIVALLAICIAVASASTCATTGCPANQACYGTINATPTCYTYGNCGIVPCPSGQSCLVIAGQAQCVAPTVCPTCSADQACAFVTGNCGIVPCSPGCFTYGNCGIVPCPSGQSCVVVAGHAQCVNAL